jgi:N-acetylglutamate synthase-like GNAT family acetyltransferase
MQITYKADILPAAEQVIDLYEKAGLPRPTKDKERIRQMFEHADLIVTAWDDDKLVGVARSITDWVWCCYLSDLAVDPGYQKSGIGKGLVELTRSTVGEQCMILLLSVPTAMEYYPKIGFAKEDRGFMINRIK